MVSFPGQNGDFQVRCVEVPECNQNLQYIFDQEQNGDFDFQAQSIHDLP